MLSIIIKNIVLMHKGTFILKIKSTFMVALVSMPFAFVAEGVVDWFELNIEFISFVFGAVILDHLIGSYVHAYIKRDFTLKKNIQGFFMKTALIIAVFFIGRGMVSILGDDNLVAAYFRTIMRLMVFLYPAGSALVNISIVTNGKFPPVAFMNKITRFNRNLDLNNFKEEE